MAGMGNTASRRINQGIRRGASHATHHRSCTPPHLSSRRHHNRIHLSHAPRNTPAWSRQLSQVRHDAGACAADTGEEDNAELKQLSRRFWWSLPLTVIVTVLAMAGHSFSLFHANTQNLVEFLLGTPVVLWAGWPFFSRGLASVRQRNPNMWTLISLGTSAAYLYSVCATFWPGMFPSTFMKEGRIGVYFEAAAVIISLTLLGQMLELKARSQTSAAIKSLLGLSPKTARRISADGQEHDVPSPTCTRAIG